MKRRPAWSLDESNFDSCLLHHFFNYRVLLYSQELEFRMKEVQAQDAFIFYISHFISALIQEIPQEEKFSLLPMDRLVF